MTARKTTTKKASKPTKPKRKLTEAQKKKNRSEAAKRAAATRKANRESQQGVAQPPVTARSQEPVTEPVTEQTEPAATEIDQPSVDPLGEEIAQLEAAQAEAAEQAEQESQPAPVEHKPAPAMLTANVKPMIGVGFMGLAHKFGPEWQLSQEELDALSEAAANVMAMYLPGEGELSPWTGLSVVVAGVLLPRALTTLMKPKGQPVEPANGDIGNEEGKAA